MKKLLRFFPKLYLKNAILVFIISASFTNLQAQLTCGSYDNFDALFNRIGRFHNGHLLNIQLNFTVPEGNVEYEQAINLIKNVNKSYFLGNVSSYFESSSNESVDSVFEDFKFFVNRDAFISKLLSTDDPVSLDRCLEQLNEFSDLNAVNKELMGEISTAIKNNINRRITNTEFEEELIRLANQWLEINDGKYYEVGPQLTGVILTIGLKSCEWWRENTEALYDDGSSLNDNNSKRKTLSGPAMTVFDEQFLLPVFALDIAGAYVGTIYSAVTQYAINGTINMNMVYANAGGGAVMGSTGIVGRIGKWLRKFF